ncbi:MAG: hypothetical protein ACLSFT_01850 [Ruminococcus callidus]
MENPYNLPQMWNRKDRKHRIKLVRKMCCQIFRQIAEIPQAYLMYGKGFLGNMTENLQADCVQSHQAGFMQCFHSTARSDPAVKMRR